MVQIAFRFQFKDVIITKALGFEKCSNGEPQCQDLKVEKKEPQQIQKACVGLASSALSTRELDSANLFVFFSIFLD